MTGLSQPPEWVRGLAQGRNGSGWGYEHEPNAGAYSWYENEVGRYIRLADGEPNPDGQQTLQRRARMRKSGLHATGRAETA